MSSNWLPTVKKEINWMWNANKFIVLIINFRLTVKIIVNASLVTTVWVNYPVNHVLKKAVTILEPMYGGARISTAHKIKAFNLGFFCRTLAFNLPNSYCHKIVSNCEGWLDELQKKSLREYQKFEIFEKVISSWINKNN